MDTLCILAIIIAILSIIGSFAIYLTFLRRKSGEKYTNKALSWLYDYLHFNGFVAEGLLKWLHLLSALFLTVFGFLALFTGRPAVFFLCALAGNALNRILYEFALLFVLLVRNVTEINRKLDKSDINNEDEKDYQFDPWNSIDKPDQPE
ncbi:MAG: hypothetical protein FWE91_03630 [Defluviitaleaceae bacterium]|nr:hypothetical protein [Defluviitaleaceae bacterium]MCL2836006.1 hypothetical protein [Defluviitaleaceae bacterium]